MPRPEGFADRYAREEMVILSRHNIRSPLSGPGSVLSRITPHEWFDWSSAPGELSLRGGALEMEMGQFFREWLVGEGFFAKDGVPEAGSVRFYANSIQRTRATARAFAAGMFPMADIDVEQHTPLGTMDPVFNPQITRLSDRFITKAYAEIFAMGGPDGPLKAKYALLEKVLDIKSSPAAAHDTTAFGAFPSAVRFELNKEPIMTGGLKMACSASDALTLQYYEEPDAVKAGFGHKLTRDEWAGFSSVKDWYQDVLFAAPSVAANVSPSSAATTPTSEVSLQRSGPSRMTPPAPSRRKPRSAGKSSSRSSADGTGNCMPTSGSSMLPPTSSGRCPSSPRTTLRWRSNCAWKGFRPMPTASIRLPTWSVGFPMPSTCMKPFDQTEE